MAHRSDWLGSPLGENSGAGGGSGDPVDTGVVQSQKLPNSQAAAAPAAATSSKIQVFSQAMGTRKHGENWKRKTNVTGTGATHMRTFHCKLNTESAEYMDQQINEWLDAHPDYEVKMVTSAVGEWTGKVKEPALVITVWV